MSEEYPERRRWLDLLEAEKRAFDKAAKAAWDFPEGSAKRHNLSCEWFAASADLLQEFCLAIDRPYVAERPPIDAVFRLSRIAEMLSTGNCPDPVTDALTAKGRPGWFPAERRHIAIAVFYVEAVRTGDLIDRAPIKTVREAFGVSSRAVHGWLHRRDEICDGVPSPPLGDLKQMVRNAGEMYRRFGRGATA